MDRNSKNEKLWVFNAGNVFSGNPKWLFVYVNKYRKDIEAWWLCDNPELAKYIRKLGYNADTFGSKVGIQVKETAGVYVVNQVKEHLPIKMIDAKILNLWHGVGCKSIERKVNFGELRERIVKKYIKYNTQYKNNQLFLVTSPLMEKHFKEQVGIDDDKVIRAGYPACTYKDDYASFNHDILAEKGLTPDTKIAVYAPTYRDKSLRDFFGKAIPNMDRLVEKLQTNNMLLIFKMHPLMNNDYQYKNVKEKYRNCPNLLFWDNEKDIYEIFDKIDLAIVDYSSIFYDMLAAGVKNFVRYIFDYEDKNNVRDFVFDYKEMTFGTICDNFDDLLNVFDHYENKDNEKREEIYNLFWSYTDENTFETIINTTLNFKPQYDRVLPTLYTFDIFDTLIQRKTLQPIGIFYYVQDKMKESDLNFPPFLKNNYQRIRRQAEGYVRDYYKKSLIIRDEDRIEIRFDDIFERMQNLYNLNDEQVKFLKEQEIVAEIENTEPMDKRVKYVLDLVAQGEDVILISDMYLPKEVIVSMLKKANPRLAKLPLFVSSDIGDQKSTKKLYLKVFEKIDYKYKEWIHYGDNKLADKKSPEQLGIKPQIHEISKFNSYELSLVNHIATYDAYLASNLMARFRETNDVSKDYYAYSFVSLYFVPYVSWAIKHAIDHDTKMLYFLSRDGHYLKIVADAIIKSKNLDIKTKYIYGSRKAWRIPSFIDHVDDEFFGPFGNFEGLTDFNSFLKALSIDEGKFDEFFPELSYLKTIDKIDGNTKDAIVTTAKNSFAYREYLVGKAREQRKIVTQYLKQEIDFDEKFAFVEYWGRGYTQDCLDRLLNNAHDSRVETIFYYARSIYPTVSTSVRYNFTSNMTSLVFVESIFANLPYSSIPGYKEENGVIVPKIIAKNNDSELHSSLEKYLAQFATNFYSLNLLDEDGIERALHDFAVDYFRVNKTNKYIVENFAPLKDSVRLYEKEVEYAPEITLKDCVSKLKGHPIDIKTKSMIMSLERSSKSVRFIYKVEKKVLEKYIYPKMKITKKKVKQVLKKFRK